MDPRLNALLAKVAEEKNLRKRAEIIRSNADEMLDDMAKEHAAQSNVGYFDAYDAVTKSELGARILGTREEAARLIEGQSPSE
ncbi:hypothetical protein HOY34_13035 [Xinfangfangia sp. D13-10-4-6]|uniref:hypothetical protein n=1 Tax=Pseudogemmobacter hezensis TaxID=2737662 RepID=UPI001552C377|nr:hypothetical protein [Pseudogemmobacter hezensis]NPD16123.1 hypothetical protein [Pseudogemmobacter hezensis]